MRCDTSACPRVRVRADPSQNSSIRAASLLRMTHSNPDPHDPAEPIATTLPSIHDPSEPLTIELLIDLIARTDDLLNRLNPHRSVRTADPPPHLDRLLLELHSLHARMAPLLDRLDAMRRERDITEFAKARDPRHSLHGDDGVSDH